MALPSSSCGFENHREPQAAPAKIRNGTGAHGNETPCPASL
ncbi:MAG: hypothetical protein QUV07_15285 [Cyanobium sp. CZS 25K]|nr:hypothetical protein [Cyanobium sp. CZS25K]